jgi:aspartate--ammonia ligase
MGNPTIFGRPITMIGRSMAISSSIIRPLDIALELSSMGIRVTAESLKKQLALTHQEARSSLPFQKAILANELPYTIGGGIGQSRLCMFYLKKAHIGEVQCSLWPKAMVEEASKNGIPLL